MKKQSIESFIKETSQQALNQLDNYFESPENINEYLNFQSQFYKYSSRNQLLIGNQYEGATAVAPYKKWQELGCNVNKGEKAIKILVPQERKTFIRHDQDKKEVVPINKATKEEKEKIKNNEIPVNKQVAFVKGNVFDVQQTNLPKEEYPKVYKELLGEVPNYDEKMNNLKDIATSLGIETRQSQDSMEGAKGFYGESQQGDKVIQLNKNNEEKQNVSTMVHELAHGIMHNGEVKQTQGDKPTEHKEFQAEMTALIVGKYMGLENDDKAIGYVHGYAKDLNNESKLDLMKDVQKTSSSLIKAINGDDAQEIYFEANKNTERAYIKPEEVKNNSMLREDQLYTLQDANYLSQEMNTAISPNFVLHQNNAINVIQSFDYSYSPNQTNLKQDTLYEHIKDYSETESSSVDKAVDKEQNQDKIAQQPNLNIVKDNENIFIQDDDNSIER
ncbi:MAG: ArdC-like ssDNA-binding domain-containing protein [Staphylococcus equorum]